MEKTVAATFEMTVTGPDKHGLFGVPHFPPRTRDGWQSIAVNEGEYPMDRAVARAVVEYIDSMSQPVWRDAKPGDVLDVRIDGGDWQRAFVQGEVDQTSPYWLSRADGPDLRPWMYRDHADCITDSRMVLRAGEVPIWCPPAQVGRMVGNEVIYTARTVAARYRNAGKHGENVSDDWLADEIDRCTKTILTKMTQNVGGAQ